MIPDPCTTVAFTGHRTYCGEASAALAAAIRGLHAHGFRTFLCGMAVGFDLAAAEAVLELRDSLPGLRLVASNRQNQMRRNSEPDATFWGLS